MYSIMIIALLVLVAYMLIGVWVARWVAINQAGYPNIRELLLLALIWPYAVYCMVRRD